MPRLVMGGAERQLLEILRRLDKHRLLPSVATTRGEGPLDAAVRDLGVELFTPRLPVTGESRALFVVPQLAGHMRRFRPDLVHLFLPEAYILGSAAALLAGCRRRVMSRLNLNIYLQTRPLVRRIEAALHRRTAALIGNSRAVVEELAEEGAPAGKLGLIPTGIDTARFAGRDRGEERARLGIAPDCLVLTVLANLWPYKGHGDLLAALDRARDALPADWVLMVAGGDRGHGPALRRQSETLGLAERVRWCGEVEDVAGLLCASDLGLLASHQESFPNVLLEYMAAGLPVVATTVGACPDVVRDGESGLLVPPHEPGALAQAIAALAGDPERRRAMGALGHRLAEQGDYAMDAVARAHQRLYLALLADRPGPVQEMLQDAALD